MYLCVLLYVWSSFIYDCSTVEMECVTSLSDDHGVPSWASDILRRLGIEALRPHQRDFLQCLQSGEDFSIVLPTGYGKSLCFMVAPFLKYPGGWLVYQAK